MREMIKMVVVLTILSFFSGGVLAYLRNSTQERIDNQVLEFVKALPFEPFSKGPATTLSPTDLPSRTARLKGRFLSAFSMVSPGVLPLKLQARATAAMWV